MVSAKQTGKDFEKRVVDRLTAWGIDEVELVPFSGAGKEKGDVRASVGEIDFLIECKKTRGRESWTLEREMLEKIEHQASISNREPMLAFSFKNSKIYTAMPLEQLLRLLHS